jgi:diadenosine tetraphosphatase ApaH/serine/threonine PP2A family protein phosphatase
VDGRSDDTTTTAATTASNSTEFQLQAALEYKEEMQKVRLAKLLQELTSLALEKKRGKGVTIQSFNTEYELEQHSKLQRGRHAVSSLQRMQTSEVDWATPETPSRIELIDLSSVDLTNLSREEAWYIIDKLHSGAGRLTVRSFLQSVRACAAILRQEPTVVDLTHADVVTVVGDIHGCLPSLRSILAIIQEDTLQEKGSEQTQPRRRRRLWGSNRPSSPLPRCIVFAGDIVDRGDDSLEVLITLLLLKLVYPNQIYLLRGNHEDTMVADVYGFSHELQTKYNLHHRLKQKVWEVMGDLFAALPMGAVTSTAFIVHGGLPSPNFTVRELRNVSVRDRCRYPTVVHPTSKVDTLLEGLLWSDPVVEPGIHPSKRGPGIQFGPDVAQAFLQRERLRYLVRAHEPVENGVKEIVCSDDTSVITVFSSANYPNGEGWNYGAVLNLFSSDGTFEATQFAYDDNGGSGGGSSTVDNHDPTTGSMLKPILDWAHQAEESILSMIGGPTSTTAFEDKLRSYVKSHQLDLAKAFAAKEHKDDGRITANDWATIMEEVLDLHDVSWIDMQPNVAPANDRGMVDWREYLIENSTDIVAALSDKERMGRTVDHE